MQRKRSPLRFIILISILALIVTGILIIRGKTRTSISPIQEDAVTKVMGIFTVRKNPEDLKKQIQKAVGDTFKNYSVYVEDYHTNFTMGINESEIFTGASINKLPILAVLYNDVQNGNKIDMDRIITLQEDDIQDYGTGSIRYDPPGSTYSVKTLIRLMMQKSDNTAAYLLGNYVVDLSTVQSVINSWGLTQTDMANNKTSNRDLAMLLHKMWTGGVADPALTAEMLGFMKDSDFEDRIPAGVPTGTTVYHKIGNGDTGQVHDVGIVSNGTVTYYIGILTSDARDASVAAKLEANISKIVYTFMR